jgi:hypothetical protein
MQGQLIYRPIGQHFSPRPLSLTVQSYAGTVYISTNRTTSLTMSPIFDRPIICRDSLYVDQPDNIFHHVLSFNWLAHR